MREYRIDFESLPWNAPAPGVRSKTFREGGRQVRLVEFGREFMEHNWCQREHVGYVLAGELELHFANGEMSRLAAGDGLLIPPGPAHAHKARVLSDLARLILVEQA